MKLYLCILYLYYLQEHVFQLLSHELCKHNDERWKRNADLGQIVSGIIFTLTELGLAMILFLHTSEANILCFSFNFLSCLLVLPLYNIIIQSNFNQFQGVRLAWKCTQLWTADDNTNIFFWPWLHIIPRTNSIEIWLF